MYPVDDLIWSKISTDCPFKWVQCVFVGMLTFSCFIFCKIAFKIIEVSQIQTPLYTEVENTKQNRLFNLGITVENLHVKLWNDLHNNTK